MSTSAALGGVLGETGYSYSAFAGVQRATYSSQAFMERQRSHSTHAMQRYLITGSVNRYSTVGPVTPFSPSATPLTPGRHDDAAASFGLGAAHEEVTSV